MFPPPLPLLALCLHGFVVVALLRHVPIFEKQVDVMVLYNDMALGRIGVTAEQMETKIADELPTANEAAANSNINLRFNLVHTEKVGRTEQNTARQRKHSLAIGPGQDDCRNEGIGLRLIYRVMLTR